MRWPRTIKWVLRTLFRRDALERDLDEELRFHLETEIQRYTARGMARADARNAALRVIGGVDQAKEQCRDARGLVFLETARQDLAYAARTLGRNPAFTVVAVLTLAVGIAANTAIFSVVNAILLRPLAIPRPDHVVRVFEENLRAAEHRASASPDNFIDWRQRARTFDGIAGFSWSTYNLIGNEQTESVEAMRVTSDFFRVLGIQPMIGRAFLPEEYPLDTLGPAGRSEARAHPKSVVLAYGLWQRAFGGRPDVVGQVLRLGDDDVRVVGVMPSDFSVPELLRHEYVPNGPDCWIPDGSYREGRRARYLSVLARVKDDIAVERAQAEMQAVARQLQLEYPKENAGWGVTLVPLRQAAVTSVRLQLRLLAGAVALLLLIACANVANLLLVRTAGRRRELAARAALGASRWRLARQLLTEALLVSALACLVGLVLAVWGVDVLVRLAPARLPRLHEIALDHGSILFGIGVSLFTGLMCGIVPALRASALDVNAALKDGGPATMDRSRRWFSNAIVVVETALALVLLIGAGLLARTLVTLNAVSLGFRPDHVVTLGFSVPPGKFRLAAGRAFYRDLLPALDKIPGVEAAAVGQAPFSIGMNTSLLPEGGRLDPVRTPVVVISPAYFRALDIALIAGRLFGPSDTVDSPSAAIISRSLAEKLWPQQNPLGLRVTSDDPARDAKVLWLTVVGVVGDVRNAGLEQQLEADLYVALNQNRNMDPNNLVVRTSGDPMAVVPAIRSVVRAIDKARAVTRVETLDDRLSRMLAPRRFVLFVIGTFSVLALALALIGVYGVVSQTVAMRTREIATRTALGAGAADIVQLVLRQTIALVMMGEVVGVGLALGLNRVMTTMVFGVTATDAATYVTVAVLWAAVAILACAIPAIRATRIDPIVALRCE